MFRLITSSNSANVPDDLEALANAARSSCPMLDFKAHITDSNGLDVARLKRSTSTFLTGIGSSLRLMLALNTCEPTPGRSRHRQTTPPPSRSSHHQMRETLLLWRSHPAFRAFRAVLHSRSSSTVAVPSLRNPVVR